MTNSDSQAAPKIDPAYREVLPGRHFVETVKIDNCGSDLDNEEGPFNGPGPDKGADQKPGACRVEQSDNKPDADPVSAPPTRVTRTKNLVSRCR